MSIPEITHIVSLLEAGKVAQARPMLEQLIQAAPEHISARVVLARLLESQSDFGAALSHWKIAAFYCPNNDVIESGLREAVLRELFAGNFVPRVNEDSAARSASPHPSEGTAPEVTAPQKATAPPNRWGPRGPEKEASQRLQAPPSELSKETFPAQGAPVLEYQDLDKLISELESARIFPDPDIKMIPPSELETEIDDVVSETLARIYANQKFYEEAALVYEKLATQRPEKAEEFLQKAKELRH
jgi:tetratricopeptide (TPR) repeat protein